MVQNDCQIETLYTVGGGAKNQLWTQIISNVTGCRQVVNAVTTGAAYGDAFLAGIGGGLIPHQQAISQWVRQERIVEPQTEVKTTYDQGFLIFKRLYRSLYDLMQVD